MYTYYPPRIRTTLRFETEPAVIECYDTAQSFFFVFSKAIDQAIYDVYPAEIRAHSSSAQGGLNGTVTTASWFGYSSDEIHVPVLDMVSRSEQVAELTIARVMGRPDFAGKIAITGYEIERKYCHAHFVEWPDDFFEPNDFLDNATEPQRILVAELLVPDSLEIAELDHIYVPKVPS